MSTSTGNKYEIRMDKSGESYIAYVPELGLIERADSASLAYKNVYERVEATLDSFEENGLSDRLSQVSDLGANSLVPVKQTLLMFFGKAGIISLVFGVLVFTLTPRIFNEASRMVVLTVDQSITTMENRILNKIDNFDFWESIKFRIVHNSKELPSKEEVEEVSQATRDIVAAIEPVSSEIRKLFIGKSDPAELK